MSCRFCLTDGLRNLTRRGTAVGIVRICNRLREPRRQREAAPGIILKPLRLGRCLGDPSLTVWRKILPPPSRLGFRFRCSAYLQRFAEPVDDANRFRGIISQPSIAPGFRCGAAALLFSVACGRFRGFG